MPPRQIKSPSPAASSPSGAVAAGGGIKKRKPLSKHQRAGLCLPVSRILSYYKKGDQDKKKKKKEDEAEEDKKKTKKVPNRGPLALGIRSDAGIALVAVMEKITRMLIEGAQRVAKGEKTKPDASVRTDARHLIKAFDGDLRDMASLCGVEPEPKHAADFAHDFEDHVEQARKAREDKDAQRALNKAKKLKQAEAKKKQAEEAAAAGKDKKAKTKKKKNEDEMEMDADEA